MQYDRFTILNFTINGKSECFSLHDEYENTRKRSIFFHDEYTRHKRLRGYK